MLGIKKGPELSIIIPVFNTRSYLIECLESVRAAIADLEAEVILIDSGSTDGSVEILEDYVEKDDRFQLYHSSISEPGASRNCGVDKANGKYIAFVDSDDFVAPDAYERMLRVAKADKCDMVVCEAIRKNREKYIHSELHRKAFHDLRHRNIDIIQDPSLVYDGTPCNRIIKTSFFRKTGIRFPEGVYYEDVPVIQQLYCKTRKVSFVRKWGYCWRIHPDSITQQQTNKKNVVDRIDMLASLKDMAADHRLTEEYGSLLDYKILSLEFNGLIAVLKDLPADVAKGYIETIAAFIEKRVDLDQTKNLTLYDQQKVKLILQRDVDGLIRLLNYKRTNYMNAPVVEGEHGYDMVLPDSIFDIEYRSFENEFNNAPYWQSIDSVDVDETGMTIHTHVYIRRVDMPDFTSQQVKAFLINDISGAEQELEVENEMRPSLTKARGTVFNYDDYNYYHYNYDGTGIAFKIDINDFADKEEFSGWNYILLECSNKVGHKNLVLRFGTKKSLEIINNTELQTEKSSVDFSTDEIQVFGIDVSPLATF